MSASFLWRRLFAAVRAVLLGITAFELFCFVSVRCVLFACDVEPGKWVQKGSVVGLLTVITFGSFLLYLPGIEVVVRNVLGWIEIGMIVFADLHVVNLRRNTP